jgi:ribosomal-protein-alanine N-acetyltransferase
MVRPRLRRSKGTIGSNADLRVASGRLLWKTGFDKFVSPIQEVGIPIPAVSLCRYNGEVSLIVREFHPSEFEALWRIDQSCFPPGISYSRAELKTYMRRRASFTLVAVETAGAAAGPGTAKGKKASSSMPPATASAKNSITGFIVAEGSSRDPGHIITIDVIAARRGAGVGSLLLDAAEERLRRADCRSVQLETAVDNISALSFYKRHGYQVIETFPRYYANGVDALVLKKELENVVKKGLPGKR